MQPAALLGLEPRGLLLHRGLIRIAASALDHDGGDGLVAEQERQARPQRPLIGSPRHPVEDLAGRPGIEMGVPDGVAPPGIRRNASDEQHRSRFRVDGGPAARADVGRFDEQRRAVRGAAVAAVAGGGHRNLVVAEISSNVGPSALAEVE